MLLKGIAHLTILRCHADVQAQVFTIVIILDIAWYMIFATH